MRKNALNFFLIAVLVFFCTLSRAKTVTESLEGAAAFDLYQNLTGAVCQEYAGKNYVALTKYGTKTCSGLEFEKNRNKSWACTVQADPKELKKGLFQSCSCTREVQVKD